jgi:chromosome segregation ATPase
MFEEFNILVAGSGFAGIIVGLLIGRLIGGKSNTPSDVHFTRKQMNAWNINDDWYDILSLKKKEEFAENELQKLEDHISRKKSERKELRKEQDAMLDDMKEIKSQVAQAEGSFEMGTILTRMGDVSAQASSIRHAFDNISNALVNFNKSKLFLQLVSAGNSKSQIIKEMNNDNLVEAIKNNDSMGLEMLETEMKSLGDDAKIQEIRKALGLSS